MDEEGWEPRAQGEIHIKRGLCRKFLRGAAREGFGFAVAATCTTAATVVWVQSLALDISYTTGVAKTKQKEKKVGAMQTGTARCS